MRFKDVVAAVVADNKEHRLNARVEDVDGDTINFFSPGFRVYWQDAGGMVISDLDQEMLSESCSAYDLFVISSPGNIHLSTRYGDPNINRYFTNVHALYGKTVKFRFVGDGVGKICAAYTAGISSETDLSKIKYRNGYNPAVFDTVVDGNRIRPVGFKLDSGFPTTGFKGAKFILKGPGYDQSRYRCSSSNGVGKISLRGDASASQGKHCKVEYAALTKEEFIAGGTPLIKMEYQDGDNVWKDAGSFQIPVPKKWAIDKGKVAFGDKATLSESTKFPALDKCRGVPEGTTTKEEALSPAFRQKYMYRRDELTNSPLADPTRYPEGEGNRESVGQVYESRDLGTFIGEWGFIVARDSSMWLGEVYSLDYLYRLTRFGSNAFGATYLNVSNYTYCRGD